ncbi:MAG: ribose ABC transporter permease [Azospirillaceae bacterium]|nr:ribose ABC transporter permease [Azospirillaceae bacterium]
MVEAATHHVDKNIKNIDFVDIGKSIVARPEFFSFIALVILVVATSFSNENFLTVDNLMNITRQVSITAIIAVGMTFVILTGGIDLSVGAIVALSSTVMAGMITNMGFPFWLASSLAVVAGMLVGLTSGVFIARFALPPIIVTLAMMEIPRGMGLLYTNGYPLPIDRVFGYLGREYVLGIPIPTLMMLAVFAVAYVILNRLPIGRYVYAVGGNEDAAILSGIRTGRIKLMVYAISGVTAGIAGVIQTSRLLSGQPNSAIGMELDAIAAVVLGGTSIAGGRGHIFGTLIGALLLGVLNNSLNMIGLSPYSQRIVKGVILLIAVLFGFLRKPNRK